MTHSKIKGCMISYKTYGRKTVNIFSFLFQWLPLLGWLKDGFKEEVTSAVRFKEGISVDTKRRAFQTKRKAKTKSYKPKGTECPCLAFGKQYFSWIEGQHVQKAGDLEKKNGKRVWAINNMEHINLTILIRVGLDRCAWRAETWPYSLEPFHFYLPTRLSEFRHNWHFRPNNPFFWGLSCTLEDI